MAARIEWAIPCRYVEVNGGLTTIAGGGLNFFWLPGFPGAVGLMAALKIVADETDHGEHVLSSQVLGPDMEPVTPVVEAGFDMGEVSPLKPEGWEQMLWQPVGIQFPAPSEGQFTWVLGIDGRTTTISLMVVQGAPGQ